MYIFQKSAKLKREQFLHKRGIWLHCIYWLWLRNLMSEGQCQRTVTHVMNIIIWHYFVAENQSSQHCTQSQLADVINPLTKAGLQIRATSPNECRVPETRSVVLFYILTCAAQEKYIFTDCSWQWQDVQQCLVIRIYNANLTQW